MLSPASGVLGAELAGCDRGRGWLRRGCSRARFYSVSPHGAPGDPAGLHTRPRRGSVFPQPHRVLYLQTLKLVSSDVAVVSFVSSKCAALGPGSSRLTLPLRPFISAGTAPPPAGRPPSPPLADRRLSQPPCFWATALGTWGDGLSCETGIPESRLWRTRR